MSSSCQLTASAKHACPWHGSGATCGQLTSRVPRDSPARLDMATERWLLRRRILLSVVDEFLGAGATVVLHQSSSVGFSDKVVFNASCSLHMRAECAQSIAAAAQMNGIDMRWSTYARRCSLRQAESHLRNKLRNERRMRASLPAAGCSWSDVLSPLLLTL